MARPVTIVGGGLAGLTLGIGLRQRDVPVTICEAGTYPRHRVCGEFISGRGQAALARLGLRTVLDEAGAVKTLTAAFFLGAGATGPRLLPSPALCLSRFILDAALAHRFRELGGELRAGRRHQETFGEGTVRATGRRASTGENDAGWFGLKIHARNVTLTADLEMHVSPHGYVGLCKINGGEVNVCGLFRRCANENGEVINGRDRLRGRPGSTLHQRLAGAEFREDSFCAVAGISLRPHPAAGRDGICAGDAITMIPPVTGNGMSMAFESAELAVAPLAARSKIARDCDAAFARRLAWAKWLQWIILTPALPAPLVAVAARSHWFWRVAFANTR
ncbi:MAG: hypothetical protein P4N60_09655 [Verrucomicrobiae bacterium]|nr:hypothetical protein [Verrucomicrobiae bacterium]